MVQTLFKDLVPKVVPTLIGPLKSGLDTFKSFLATEKWVGVKM